MHIDATSGGLSRQRLAYLTQGLEGYVQRGELAGAVALIYRHGQLAHVDVVGAQDEAAQVPLQRDTIFRIASMTKPVTSVAALMLLEDGLLRLDDPVERWLPELANPQVLRDPAGPLDDVYPAPRSITVCDLLTHRPGFVSGLYAEGPIAAAAQALQSHILLLNSELDADDWLRRLGALPLCYAPGERMNYGYTTDVLGLLVARAAGKPFADVLRTRIFEPLGMEDTAFWVPAEKRQRFAAAYGFDPQRGVRVEEDNPHSGRWTAPPRTPSGSAGLVSTADDYLKFGRMLLDGGRRGDVRLLGRKSIELMTSDFLTPAQRAMPFFSAADYWAGRGFGLGVYVVDKPAAAGRLGSVGQYGWGGAYGTLWFNDPREDMVCVLMVQLLLADLYSNIGADFQNLVYQAIDDV